MLMTITSKRTFVLGASLFIALVVGIITLIIHSSPKLFYEIKTTVIDEAPQEPLILTHNADSFNFETKFYDLKGNFNAAILKPNLKFQTSWPFITLDKNIVVELTDQEIYEEESFVYYEISGIVANLKPGEYKFTLIDSFGNLIDETFVTLP